MTAFSLAFGIAVKHKLYETITIFHSGTDTQMPTKRLSRKFISGLEEDTENQEHLANDIEDDARQYDQVAAFARYIANLRRRVAEIRELIKAIRHDPALK